MHVTIAGVEQRCTQRFEDAGFVTAEVIREDQAQRGPGFGFDIIVPPRAVTALFATLVWWHGQRSALDAAAVAYARADLSESEGLREAL